MISWHLHEIEVQDPKVNTSFYKIFLSSYIHFLQTLVSKFREHRRVEGPVSVQLWLYEWGFFKWINYQWHSKAQQLTDESCQPSSNAFAGLSWSNGQASEHPPNTPWNSCDIGAIQGWAAIHYQSTRDSYLHKPESGKRHSTVAVTYGSYIGVCNWYWWLTPITHRHNSHFQIIENNTLKK